jgi:hypothetical protein
MQHMCLTCASHVLVNGPMHGCLCICLLISPGLHDGICMMRTCRVCGGSHDAMCFVPKHHLYADKKALAVIPCSGLHGHVLLVPGLLHWTCSWRCLVV